MVALLLIPKDAREAMENGESVLLEDGVYRVAVGFSTDFPEGHEARWEIENGWNHLK